MKRIRLIALITTVAGNLIYSQLAHADVKAVAQFTAHQVEPVILSPRSTVVVGHSSLSSNVALTLDGVLVRPTGPAGVFNEVIIQDGDGNILGSSNAMNAEGSFVVKFSHAYPVFSQRPADIVVLGRTKDDLWFANNQLAGLQTDQYFYNGSVIEVKGQYPGGQHRIDASIYQRGRVTFNKASLMQDRVTFNPRIKGRHTVDRFNVNVEYEGTTIWPSLEIVTTGNANPRNILVTLVTSTGKVMHGVVKHVTQKNRATIHFAQPLEFPIGQHSVELRVRLGGTFARHQSAVFLFNTDKMQALGSFSGYPLRVLSDLSPASNTVSSVEIIYSR